MSNCYYVPQSQSSCESLSLYKETKQEDYHFIDNVIHEQYSVGGLDIYVHKYLGPIAKGDDTNSLTHDATQPGRDSTDPLFIEDVLFLENRDRDYEDDVYRLRGVYNVQDIDFEVSQFGLNLTNDTLFITFHYNDMVSLFGRKLMSGDVVEVPNLKDHHPLDDSYLKALPKLYAIQDASFASEGFSQTWLPHLWRVKATPLVGSQEYKEITDKAYALTADDIDNSSDNTDVTSDLIDNSALGELIETHNKNTEINTAIVDQAETELPVSGYDVSKFYVVPHGMSGEPQDGTGISSDNTNITSDSGVVTADRSLVSPVSNGWLGGYLTGNNVPPNGLEAVPCMQFPHNPLEGDYALRTDYYPNRLFRFDGTKWKKVEDNIRTGLTPGPNNKTARGGYVNNTETINTDDGVIPSRQGLSKLLEIKEDM